MALNYSYPTEKRVSFKSIFSGEIDNRFNLVNDVINLCFKYDLDTKNSKFEKFSALDDYYLWLLDMDKFDYAKFQPYWIGEYPTRYYYRKIASNAKVKKILNGYLKNNHDSKIERDYFNIFIRKTWKIR